MAHTILIVEDELKIRELLRGYFEPKRSPSPGPRIRT
jgi:hypothetical protein